MIADLKPYPAMKDSGVSWLEEVPEHWEVLPLCAIARPKSVINQEDRALLSVYLGSGVIPFSEVKEKRTNVTSDDLSKYQAVDPGDFVLNNQQAWRGSVGVSSHKGIVSPAYLVLSLDSRIQRQFANLLFREKAMVAQYLICSKGVGSIQRNLYWPYLKRAVTILPPLPEQTAIVHFLDHVDRRIRRYTRAKQKLIKLLEEQKQAIIHRAVTHGLDPNVRLKPSGVEWLRDVPEHWEVSRLKFVATQIVDCLHATPVYSENGGYPAIRTADVQPGRLLFESARRVDEDHYLRWTARLTPEEGDILYTREGERFGIAALVPANVRLCISQRMMVFRIHRTYNSAYVMWQINCQHVYAQAAADLIGAAAPHVNVERIKNLWLILPPRSEQDSIVAAVEAAHVGPNNAIARAHDEIALLREYRTRLIGDVVTGKLDVRDTAARLSDEVEEPEPIDETDTDTVVDADAADELEAVTEKAEA